MKGFACWLIPRLRAFAGVGVLVLLALVDNIREHPDRLTKMLPFLLVTIAANITVAVWATAFTYSNYDEVAARSKRWQRGNSEGRNSRTLHCVGVFVQSLFSFWSVVGLAIGIVCLKHFLFQTS